MACLQLFSSTESRVKDYFCLDIWPKSVQVSPKLYTHRDQERSKMATGPMYGSSAYISHWDFSWSWKFTGMYSHVVPEPTQNLFCWRFLPLASMLMYYERCQLGWAGTLTVPKIFFFNPSIAVFHVRRLHTFWSLFVNLEALWVISSNQAK